MTETSDESKAQPSGKTHLIFYTFNGNTLVFEVTQWRIDENNRLLATTLEKGVTHSLNFPQERCVLTSNFDGVQALATTFF